MKTEPDYSSCFTAVDLETANYLPDSACAIAMVRVESGEITEEVLKLIKPHSKRFDFTHVHGISWQDVRQESCFSVVWSDLAYMLQGIDFLAAHNASFDRRVLDSCCIRADIPTSKLPYVCSMMMAKRHLRLGSYSLPSVCSHLGIPLEHHNPLSDAKACALVVLALSKKRGYLP